VPIGSVSLCAYRPFPVDHLRAMLGHARHIVVIEKCLAPGQGGIMSMEIQTALTGLAPSVATIIAGLGGRTITRKALRAAFERAHHGTLPPLTFLDLNEKAIAREPEITAGELLCR